MGLANRFLLRQSLTLISLERLTVLPAIWIFIRFTRLRSIATALFVVRRDSAVTHQSKPALRLMTLFSSFAQYLEQCRFGLEGALSIAQDAPADFAYVFNQTNVTEGGFNYSGSSLKTRHTCVSVKYFDLDLRDYVYELVEDEEAIKKYGYIKTQINAFACTS